MNISNFDFGRAPRRASAHDAATSPPTRSNSTGVVAPLGASVLHFNHRKITVLDVQRAWAHNEPDETLTLTDLLRGALRAKEQGDDHRALLLLEAVNRKLRERQLDATRELGL